jgi:lipoprotein-anchoring transpeptidase ErfK/SrfK
VSGREPLHREHAPAGRLAAAGAAATVTLLTLAGALGFGPGAAMGQMKPSGDVNNLAAQLPDQRPVTDGDSSAGSATDDGWLRIDDTPPTHRGLGSDSPESTALPKASGSGERVVYDISAQRVWLVNRAGNVTRTYLVSGGKDPKLLDPGRYHVYSKSRHAVSYNHKETMNYMVRFATGDHAPIGFHDVPARRDGTLAESRSELGTPMSSGCIRQWISDARAMWDFADIDTPVIVTA